MVGVFVCLFVCFCFVFFFSYSIGMLSTLSCAFIYFCLPFLGDGANDVSMIQAADVGIGISGQEGMQVSLQFTSPSLLSNRPLLINKFSSSLVV